MYKWTVVRNVKIIDMVDRGTPPKEVAEKMNLMSVHVVYRAVSRSQRALVKRGLKTMKTGRKAHV